MRNVPVDTKARIDIAELKARLDECLTTETPVFAVVAVIGTTEEGSVDPLDQILALRSEFQEKGLFFLVHADAAWGGYFASMIREPPKKTSWFGTDNHFVPKDTLREYTVKQLGALAKADTITIDPHKAGYIPYPAGGLCLRDGRLRHLVTWGAPYLAQSTNDGESIGIYGVEGRSVVEVFRAKSVIDASAVSLVHRRLPLICTTKL